MQVKNYASGSIQEALENSASRGHANIGIFGQSIPMGAVAPTSSTSTTPDVSSTTSPTINVSDSTTLAPSTPVFGVGNAQKERTCHKPIYEKDIPSVFGGPQGLDYIDDLKLKVIVSCDMGKEHQYMVSRVIAQKDIDGNIIGFEIKWFKLKIGMESAEYTDGNTGEHFEKCCTPSTEPFADFVKHFAAVGPELVGKKYDTESGRRKYLRKKYMQQYRANIVNSLFEANLQMLLHCKGLAPSITLFLPIWPLSSRQVAPEALC